MEVLALVVVAAGIILFGIMSISPAMQELNKKYENEYKREN